MKIEAVDMTDLMRQQGQPTHPILWGVKVDEEVVASFEDIPSLGVNGEESAKAFVEHLSILDELKGE